MKKFLAIFAVVALSLMTALSFSPAHAVNVNNPSAVPVGAVEQHPSQYYTDNPCDTTRSWVLTVPGSQEKHHDEFRLSRNVTVPPSEHIEHRWMIETRAYTPGTDEKTHTEYKYSRVVPGTEGVHEYLYQKTVPAYVTEYQYQKQTRTTVQHGASSAPVLVSDWSWWEPARTQWSTKNVDVLQSGNHANWTAPHNRHTDFFDRDYRYVKNGVTRQVESGTTTVDSGWTTDALGNPWVLVDTRWKTEPTPDTVEYYHAGAWTTDVLGSPWKIDDTRTVVDSEATEGVFSEWAPLAWSDWTVDPANMPDDPDGTTDENDPKNLTRIGVGESRTVVDAVGTEYTEYYVRGAEPSRNRADASWVTKVLPGWTKFDHRVVVDAKAIPQKTTHYNWSNNVQCATPALPNTGGPSHRLVAVSAVLIACGLVVVWFSKRRTR